MPPTLEPFNPCRDMVSVNVGSCRVFTWDNETVDGVGTMEVSPPGYNRQGLPIESPQEQGERWYPVGTELTLKFSSNDPRYAFYRWNVGDTQVQDSRRATETLLLRSGRTYGISCEAGQFSAGVECRPDASRVNVTEGDGIYTEIYPQANGSLTYEVLRIHFPAWEEVKIKGSPGTSLGFLNNYPNTSRSYIIKNGNAMYARAPLYSLTQECVLQGASTQGGHVSSVYKVADGSIISIVARGYPAHTRILIPSFRIGNLWGAGALQAWPWPGFAFSHWENFCPNSGFAYYNDDGSFVACSPDSPDVINVTYAKPNATYNFKANFWRNQFPLTTQARLQNDASKESAARAGGYVTIDEEKKLYTYDDDLRLEALEMPGYAFHHWEGNGYLRQWGSDAIPMSSTQGYPLDTPLESPLRQPELNLIVRGETNATAVYAKKDLVICEAKAASCLLTVEVEPNVQTKNGNYECMEGREITFTLDSGQIGGCSTPAQTEFKLVATSPDMTYNRTVVETAREIRQDLTLQMPVVPENDADHKVRVNVTASVKLGGVTHTQDIQIAVYELAITYFGDCDWDNRNWKIVAGKDIRFEVTCSSDCRLPLAWYVCAPWTWTFAQPVLLGPPSVRKYATRTTTDIVPYGVVNNAHFGESSIAIALVDGENKRMSVPIDIEIFYAPTDQVKDHRGNNVPAWFRFYLDALEEEGIDRNIIDFDPDLGENTPGEVEVTATGSGELGGPISIIISAKSNIRIGPAAIRQRTLGNGMQADENGPNGRTRIFYSGSEIDGITAFYANCVHEKVHWDNAIIGAFDQDQDHVADSLEVTEEDTPEELPPPGQTFQEVYNTKMTDSYSGPGDGEYRAYYYEWESAGESEGVLANDKFDEREWTGGALWPSRNWFE